MAETDRNREIIMNGERLVRLRQVRLPIGGFNLIQIQWTLTNPFGRRRLIPPQMFEARAREIAAREGWKVLG